MKEITQKNFTDWFSEHFGYGYGTGEQYTVPALKGFFDACEDDGRYDHEKIEKKIGKGETWFLMNILCSQHILNYGTSPRYGWLDEKGKLLKKYLSDKTVDELYEQVTSKRDDECASQYCNCGGGYKEGKKCDNPLF